MALIKILGNGVFAGGALTRQDWIMILGILITALSILQEYLKNRGD